MKKYVIILCGLPGTGKSTWVKEFLKNDYIIPDAPDVEVVETVVLSGDKHIEKYASKVGISYNEAFHLYQKESRLLMNLELFNAIKERKHIIWDNTNLSKKIREKRMASIPNSYGKLIIYFPYKSIEDLHEQQIRYRSDKVIDMQVLRDMEETLEIPTGDNVTIKG
ncbi:MAG: hypothetical protein COA52_00410 [Hyphomicrobiales bacterium]|nr:MAG: hypothetical protein COA52_00410 [Hyphomicrobiales bacterium]